MTAAASLLDLIGERTSPERAPAARAFAQAFLRRLSADGGDAELEPEVLCREIVGAFEFASARGAEAIAVRAFTPTRRGARLRGAGLRRRDQHGGLAVPRRLRQRGAARPRPGHPARAAPDRRRGARRRRGDRGGAAPARGVAARVGHALRPRPAAGARRARGARGGPARGALRRPRHRPRLPLDGRPRAADGPARGGGRVALHRRGGRRDRRLPRVAAARQLHLPRLPRVPLPRRHDRRRARLGARDPRRHGAVVVREAGADRLAAARACASARSTATC